MSKELMIVEQPDFLAREGLDVRTALHSVYRRYGFRLQQEIEAEKDKDTFIVAAKAPDDPEPQPITRADFYAHILDPVRGKVEAKARGLRLSEWASQGNMLVFVFVREA